MARKRPIQDPPPASSSSEEEEEEKGKEAEESSEGNSSAEDDDEPKKNALEESDEEDDEDEEEKTPLKKLKPDSGKVGSDSDSDSDKSLPSPNVSDFTIKPIVTKPNKPAPKSTPKPKQKKPPSSASNGGVGNAKTPGTARLWSEADEIAILKGMIEYKSKKGSDPYADSSGFHDFIKKSIQADVSQYQLKEKIRRLKKKYTTNAEKGLNGNDPVFSKPHDQKSFELSKKIWGNETTETNKRQKKMKTLGSEDEDKTEVNGIVTLGLPCFDKDKEVNAFVSTQVSSDSDEEVEKLDFWKDYPCLKEFLEMGKFGRSGGFMMEIVVEEA
ncbi:hypothetical protein REPUB_Repub04eG0121400 [Reevesia pubescens]